GFVDAAVLVEGLKRAGHELTRSGFIKAIESLHNQDIGLGDLKITYSSVRHKGSDSVYPTVVKDGQAIAITDWHTLKKL
ncbi:hypothetical protein ABTB72_19550, partial [Acinetobacter baumannii]